MTRSEALIRAQQKYDRESRQGKPVSFRLDEKQMGQLDEARGDKSRSAFVKEIVLKEIGED